MSKYPRTILNLSFLIVFGHAFGQDTAIYYQENASLFYNTYTFIRDKETDKSGVFYQEAGTDDMQAWYGRGTFTETKNKYYLTFDTTTYYNRIEASNNLNYRDTLYIKWYDWHGKELAWWFKIKYTDTTKNEDIYNIDWQEEVVKIPIADLKDSCLSLYNSNKKIIDFIVPNNTNEIKVFANDTAVGMHVINKKQETLKKGKGNFRESSENTFITIGMWTKGKKITFRRI